MVHAYSIDSLADAPSDPRLTADRLAVLAPTVALTEQARGSYYINAVAVSPECRGGGIGNRLMALAMSEAQETGLRRSESACIRAKQPRRDALSTAWIRNRRAQLGRCPSPHPPHRRSALDDSATLT
jgi:GNAT superfamily N-acetyltransferase